LSIIQIEKSSKLKGRDPVGLQVYMKDGWSDIKTLYDDSFVAHHKISLAFENMLKVLVCCYIIRPDKKIHELEAFKLFIDWRI
jgi:hypothetical protein